MFWIRHNKSDNNSFASEKPAEEKLGARLSFQKNLLLWRFSEGKSETRKINLRQGFFVAIDGQCWPRSHVFRKKRIYHSFQFTISQLASSACEWLKGSSVIEREEETFYHISAWHDSLHSMLFICFSRESLFSESLASRSVSNASLTSSRLRSSPTLDKFARFSDVFIYHGNFRWVLN